MENRNSLKDFLNFSLNVILIHTVTYFLFGLIMSNIFDYKEVFNQPIIRDFMRPINSPYVFAGPFLQPIRGLLFAVVLWPIRNIFLERRHGWLIIWSIFVVIGILATPAAAPCSIEGILYSKLPLWFHLMGLPEMLLQTLSFSLILNWWTKRTPRTEMAVNLNARKIVFLRIIFAIMIGCFAYMGYAVGSILSARIAGVQINFDAAASDMKGQMMFVFAFVINVVAILIFSSKSCFSKISFRNLFFIFWAIDTLSPLIYRWVLYGHMRIHLALIIGLFPALVMIISYKANYKNFAKLNNIVITQG